MPSVGWVTRSEPQPADTAARVTREGRILNSFASVEAADWDALDHGGNPFLTPAFLGSLEASGVLGPDSGWIPQHLALYENSRLVAFAPTYVKSHSHGEFVFDWAWADAYRRHGLSYYPKLLTGLPYSPVGGTRLLLRRGYDHPEDLRRELVDLAIATCEQLACSSWHCNFVTDEDAAALAQAGLLERQDWQFHWANAAYRDFDAFLETLRSRKRKNIRRERRQVSEAGVEFRWLDGTTAQPADLDFVYRCYRRTFEQYGNHAALNRDFFSRLAAGLRDRFLVSIARIGEEPLAMSLFLAGDSHLYGRYWGCLCEVPGLHFEAAYYQGIEYCIRHGLRVFESGAQGEHKIARGFVPTRTRSFHHIREPAFREAIARYLEREANWSEDYGMELEQHLPYRAEGA